MDHFKPKSKYPDHAYEWKNYRLVSQLLNSRKSAREDIVDPFEVKPGWFIIDFPSLLVKPGSGLSKRLQECLIITRDALGLNDEGSCMMMRQQFVTDYCSKKITFAHLEERAPFLALQMKEQDLVDLLKIQGIMHIH